MFSTFDNELGDLGICDCIWWDEEIEMVPDPTFDPLPTKEEMSARRARADQRKAERLAILHARPRPTTTEERRAARHASDRAFEERRRGLLASYKKPVNLVNEC
jgi:hypothetical protein